MTLGFHWYGFIVSLAMIVGLLLVEKQALKQGVNSQQFWSAAWMVVVVGIVGARLYHVATDYHLYWDQPWRALLIWQGGLSIIGAVLGGSLTLWWLARMHGWATGKLLDLAVFGLPLAQAIGRWGNFVNQELYGLPTQLPWAVMIDLQHRLPGFEQVASYHPLFAYEAIMTGVFGMGLWLFYPRLVKFCPQLHIGTGVIAIVYLLYYSLVRFGLDFLRIDKTIGGWGLGVNQWVLLAVAGVSGVLLVKKWLSRGVTD